MFNGVIEWPCSAIKMDGRIVGIFWNPKIPFHIVRENRIQFLDGILRIYIIRPNGRTVCENGQKVNLKDLNNDF